MRSGRSAGSPRLNAFILAGSNGNNDSDSASAKNGARYDA